MHDATDREGEWGKGKEKKRRTGQVCRSFMVCVARHACLDAFSGENIFLNILCSVTHSLIITYM